LSVDQIAQDRTDPRETMKTHTRGAPSWRSHRLASNAAPLPINQTNAPRALADETDRAQW